MSRSAWRAVAVSSVLLLSACDGEGTVGVPYYGPTPTAAGVNGVDAPPAADPTADQTADEAAAAVLVETTTTTLPPAPMPPNSSFADVKLGFDPVAEIDLPTALTWKGNDPTMYVTTQDGYVYSIADGVVSTVLDLSAEVSEYANGSERGLLGIAFDPRDGRMFLNYTDTEHDTHVVSYELADGVAVPGSKREYLYLDQPGLGHNGGRLLFDDEGHLFISSGDGGGSKGRDAQDTTKLFGVIMRIIPSLEGGSYDIPPDNPFADGVADRPEVWARGLRNPWTFSIDEATGDMWIGDVGNDVYEEVSVMRGGQSGLNFGWDYYEGTEQRIFVDVPNNLVPPVHAYPRSEGVAVMVGHVYRGAAIPELRGALVFGDLTGPIWALGTDGVTRLNTPGINVLTGWGEDASGELYLLSHSDGVFKLVPG